MKFLCICQYGHSRSVAMTRALHHWQHEAIAAGAGTSPSAIQVLAAWADFIIVMEPQFKEVFPRSFDDKTLVNNVGPDKWVNPYAAELRDLCEAFVARNGWTCL